MFSFIVISVLVLSSIALFSAAAMWDGPDGSLRIWLNN